MAGPFQHGSSGYSDPASPVSSSTIPAPSSSRRRHPSSDIPSLANFYSHPSRTSLLNSAGDLNLGSSVNYGNSAQNDNGDWEESPLGGFPRAWRNAGLPSFSRAFNILMSTDGADDSSPNEDGFFVPSYLEGSTYAKKLEEAHKSRMQGQRDSKRSNGGSGQTTAPSPFFNALPPGSHRGMSHTVHERPPPFEEEETVAPLPTKWNKDDQWGGIEIQADTLSIKHVGLKGQQDREHEASAARADHYMPAQCGIYYYEVQILSAKSNEYVTPFERPRRATEVKKTNCGSALPLALDSRPDQLHYHGLWGGNLNPGATTATMVDVLRVRTLEGHTVPSSTREMWSAAA